MTEAHPSRFKRLAFIPPVILGILILAFVLRGREGPQRQELSEQATLVRVVQVQRVDVVPRATGFGTVKPEQEWSAVAEVVGTIVERDPRAMRGAIIPAGTLLLRIDPSDYELALARADANLASVDAELASLAAKTKNLQASRDIEQRSLTLSQRDLERKKALKQRGNISDAALDEQERAVLVSLQRVQDLDNSLALLPAERSLLLAKKSLNTAQRTEAGFNLTRTVVRAPFDLRLTDIRVERTQFVRQGDILAIGDSIAVAEIEAEYPLDHLLPLVSADLDFRGLSAAQLAEMAGRFGLQAVVRFRTGGVSAQWPATVSRSSDALDPRTRAFGIIVTVDEPIRSAVPGQRPPLVKGMLVEVELRGKPQPDSLILPRETLRQGDNGETLVYLADNENRLRRRPVTVGFSQDDFVTVVAGVTAGERIILSDIIPAVDGMLLQIIEDTAAAQRVAASATGTP